MSTAQIIRLVVATILLGLVGTLVGAWIQNRWFRRRHAHQSLWRKAFPEPRWRQVDEALGWICRAFALPLEHRHALKPSDRIWEIYRRYYPEGSLSDNMEIEDLYHDLEAAGHDADVLGCEDVSVRDIVIQHAGPPLP